MNKFEAKAVASRNGWEQTCGHALCKPAYREEVPNGTLRVYLNIGYELSTDTPEDGATLELHLFKPSTAHPILASNSCCITGMSESGFALWLDENAHELIERGRKLAKDEQ